jgi:hypothetical protein
VDIVIIGNWLTYPLFRWNGLSVTASGFFALVTCIVIGFALAGVLQSSFTSGLLDRIGLDKRFFAIVRFVLSLFFIVGFFLFGLNLAGLAVPWEQRIPGLNLSLAQMLPFPQRDLHLRSGSLVVRRTGSDAGMTMMRGRSLCVRF